MGIEILLVQQKSKQLKQFVLIFVFDTYPSIKYRDFNKLFTICVCNPYLDLNFSFLRKLECVRLKAKENLLDPIFVRPDYWSLEQRSYPILSLYAFISNCKFQAQVSGFLLLNLHYLLDSVSYVEGGNIFSKLTGLYLRIIE